MNQPTYDFRTQQRIGDAGEELLDHYFVKWFDIHPASEDEQRLGIDRWFVRKQTSHQGVKGERFAVEYKTDTRACHTGKAFVETVSVERGRQKVQGWAYTSRARWLVYYCPGDGEVAYLFSFAQLRARLDRWKRDYHETPVRNRDYTTRGILVPLHEFERYAIAVINF